jgi:hypothetical protein
VNPATVVALSSILDLDDLCAKISKHKRTILTGEQAGQIKYFDAV